MQALQKNIKIFLTARVRRFFQHLCALFREYWNPGQSAGDRLMQACREQAALEERRHQMQLAEIREDDYDNCEQSQLSVKLADDNASQPPSMSVENSY